MTRRNLVFYFFLISWAFFQTTVGQTPIIRIPDPLSVYEKTAVEALFTDRSSHLWIGTKSGLILYNGLEARLFTTADSLPQNHVTAIAQGKDGVVWFGHENGSISYYSNQKIRSFNPPEGVPKKKITAMLGAKNGSLWFATDSIGLWYYDGARVNIIDQDNGLVEPAAPGDTTAKTDDFAGLIPGLEEDASMTLTAKTIEIYTIIEDERGHIWVGTDAGITIIDPSKKDKARFTYLTSHNGLPDNIIKEMHLSDNANVLISFLDAGIGYYNYKTKTLDMLEGWTFGSLQAACHTQDGSTYIGAKSGKLVVYNPDHKHYKVIDNFTQNVTSIIEDAEGNIWLGCQKGIYQLMGDRFSFLDMENGLPSKNITSVMVDDKGAYWIGSDAGLTHFVPNINEPPTVKTIATKIPGSTKIAQPLSIVQGKDGHIWVGAFGAGLLRIQPDKMQTTMYSTQNGLPQNDVKSVAVAPNGNIWLGTLGGGLVTLELDEKNAVKKMVKHKEEGSFSAEYIYALHFDAKGRLWIATDGKGAYLYDGVAFENVTAKHNVKINTFYSVTSDADGNIWFGSAGQGVFRFDGKSFKNYSIAEGLRGDSPESIIIDSKNRLVITNRFGLDILDTKSGKISYFSDDDGLQSAEPQTNAVFRDSKSRILIGSNKGVIVYNPNSSYPLVNYPVISITRLRVMLKDEKMETGKEYPYNQNQFTFDFVGIAMSAPKKTVYQYMLEGYDKEWSLETPSRFITYSNLPAGEYKFMVRARNGSGDWTPVPATYAFVINPPFWKTWWFITLSVIFILGSSIAAVQWRLSAIEKEKRVLEQKVQERTIEIQEKNTQLGQAYEELNTTLEQVQEQKNVIEEKSVQVEQAYEELNATLEQVQAQKEIIERKNDDITESILYAERLQKAILPETEYMKRTLKDYFVFYQPKDIVSGDFYWYTDLGEKQVAAAVDCTGHGVPGAFMSVVGYNQLNEVINTLKMTDPAQILTEMDRRVRKTLKQEDASSATKDGMDIALCMVDRKNNLVEFGGAYRPLFILKNGEIEEIRGDRFPIGGAQAETKNFTTHRIEMQPGEAVFFFSDGIVDQFGGPNGRKFTPKRLRETLLSLKDLPFEEQGEKMRQIFNEWMGDKAQIDDVLLIGIKF